MKIFKFKEKSIAKTVLALGAESAGNFSVFHKGNIYFSEDFGDLLNENNYEKFQKAVLNFLKKNKLKPNIILTDLHPLYKTTFWGAKLAKKFRAKHIQIQHHLAHIFSNTGEKFIQDTKYQIPDTIFGIALDGTGYGLDGKIWGGEIFELQTKNHKLKTNRVGHLENQIMIGGDLAVREPVRILLAILSKFLDKTFICEYMKAYYSKNKFELLYNQLQNNFNCIETSSTGRVLDAVSVLLGFCKNERNYKHEPIELLEQNSTKPYNDLKPKIIKNPPSSPFYKGGKLSPFKKGRVGEGFLYELDTTHLFEYLIKNLHKDKKRLAATAQLYIAQGLYEIIKKHTGKKTPQTFIAGGIADNKIISAHFESKGAYKNKTVPRGDAGLSIGQIIYFISQHPPSPTL